MKFSITQKNFKADKEVRDFVDEKLGKLDNKFQIKISNASIVLQKKKYLFYAEIRVQAKNVRVFGESTSENSIFAAIEQSINKVETQLKKHKEKVKGRKSKASLAHKKRNQDLGDVTETLDAENARPDGSILDRVDLEHKILQPMSVEEAVLQMDTVSEKMFEVFINSRTNEINVIYRKGGNGYGVIVQKK
ncbi:MAG: ribosome-associated translation inhibitor RaiA [Candidatus Omnitrophica bacterium]|nr:ribosome-associated translation inhibitor RaiA [Candidatus Omnitrophota bacterium]